MTDKDKKPGPAIKFHEVPNVLRKKIGSGGIEPEKLARAESVLDDQTVDFNPLLNKFIGRLQQEMADTSNLSRLRPIVMDIKANGGTFGYRLVSELGAVVLEFLETVEILDVDGLRIMQEFDKALQLIVIHRLSGDGGKEGQALAQEFYAVCDRYIRKYR